MVRIFKIPGFISYLFPYRIWNLSLKTNSVYLTFDDGPQPNVTNWVLDFLKSENISATFFCIGENVKQHPEIFKRIIAYNTTGTQSNGKILIVLALNLVTIFFPFFLFIFQSSLEENHSPFLLLKKVFLF